MKRLVMLILLIVMAMSSSVLAGGGIWLGQGADGSWDDPSNWEHGVPTAADDGIIHLWDPSIQMPAVVDQAGMVAKTVWISNASFGTDGELTVNNGTLVVTHVKLASAAHHSRWYHEH